MPYWETWEEYDKRHAKEEADRLKKEKEDEDKKKAESWKMFGFTPGALANIGIDKYNQDINSLNKYHAYAQARSKLTSYLVQNPHALPNDLFNIDPAEIERFSNFYSDLEDRPWQAVETNKFKDYNTRLKNLHARFAQLEKKYGSLPQLTKKLTQLGQTQSTVSRRILS